ncbi:4-alpha-glucanotransferase [Candidatus Sumerlaeota bacterium]|nr:4-alpha-glucanotransferase [Candidatus Sumerlaeota bacterium]
MALEKLLGRDRSSLILLHPSSLPDPEGRAYGIGELGSEAWRFADFLFESGTAAWQVLPLGHTGYMNSPYQTFSRFAGSPYLVSVERLLEAGDLTVENHDAYVEAARGCAGDRADFGWLYRNKLGSNWDDSNAVLRQAYRGFKSRPADDARAARFRDFCDPEHSYSGKWLADYAEYMALKESCGQRPWSEWDEDLRYVERWRTSRDAVLERTPSLVESIEFFKYLQFVFWEQWEGLRKRMRELGRTIIGDIPWYVGHDSADVWANREVFDLDSDAMPNRVAGVPPDYFSEDGQLWGNPLYDWDNPRAVEWWTNSIEHLLRLTDLVRIDHFRAADSYWKVPQKWARDKKNARNGCWAKGPGAALLGAIRDRLMTTKRIVADSPIPIIAEDLGYLDPLYATPEDYPEHFAKENRFKVDDDFRALMKSAAEALGAAFDPKTGEYSTRKGVDLLLAEFSLPSMRVLQFGFESVVPDEQGVSDVNVVVYTGTHDNDTVRGWYEESLAHEANSSQEGEEKIDLRIDRALECVGISAGATSSENGTRTRDVCRDLLRIAFGSQSVLAGAPVQELLRLGSEARMNLPGDCSRSWWVWRATREQMDYPKLSAELGALNRISGRFDRRLHSDIAAVSFTKT